MALGALGQVHISVTDIDASVAFYRDVLGMTHLFTVPGQSMAFFQSGDVRLYLGVPTSPEYRSQCVLYFNVDDLDAEVARLEGLGVDDAGAAAPGAPRRQRRAVDERPDRPGRAPRHHDADPARELKSFAAHTCGIVRLPIVIDAAVRVVYRKYDGSLHWHQTMNRLGEDTHGVWLGAPAGVIARKGEHGPPVVSEHAHVMLFAPDAWWTASFNAAPHVTEIYVDVTTPPVWTDPGEVTMVDLDLDVLRRRADHSVVIVDQDEFAEHQIRYAYPTGHHRRRREGGRLAARASSGTARSRSPPTTGRWLAMVS